MVSRKLNIGCGPHYAKGWLNTEVKESQAHTKADYYVEDPMVLPFGDKQFDQVYCGHVLEHVPWTDVPRFLTEISRVLVDGGELMVVGPDAIECIELYKRDMIPTSLLMATIEGYGPYIETTKHDFPGQCHFTRWDQDRHHWNCSEGRMAMALQECLAFSSVTVIPRTPNRQLDLAGIDTGKKWPVVSAALGQFSVRAVK